MSEENQHVWVVGSKQPMPIYPYVAMINTIIDLLQDNEYVFYVIERSSKTTGKIQQWYDVDTADVEGPTESDKYDVEKYIDYFSKLETRKKALQNETEKIVQRLEKQYPRSNLNAYLSRRNWFKINGRKQSTTKRRSVSPPRSLFIDTYPFPRTTEFPGIISIGPNTTLYRENFNKVRWKKPASATHDLCKYVFSNSVLAKHSLTGNPSPAMIRYSRSPKRKLSRVNVDEITEFVVRRLKEDRQRIRHIIIMKCAANAHRARVSRQDLNSDYRYP